MTMLATIDGTSILLTIHVLAAVVWVGGGVTMHAFGRLARKSGDRERMNQFSKDAAFIGPRFYAPLSAVLLIAGIFLVKKAGYEMSDAFVSIGFTGWIISFLVGVLYYPRAGKRREAIVASDGLQSDAFLASYAQVAKVNMIELTILLLVVIDMALKPGT